jgi:outer membrane protein assembly factor BamB
MDGDKGSCMYCGTIVERQASTAERPRFAVRQTRHEYPPASYSAPGSPPPRRGGALAVGIIMSAIFVAVGIGIGLLLATWQGGGSRPGAIPGAPTDIAAVPEAPIAPSPVAEAPPSAEIGSINELIAGLPRDGQGENLLVYVNNPNDQGISVALIDGGSHAARWKSRPLSKQAYQGLLVAGIDMAYLTDQDRLLALRLNDGSVAWEAALLAEPSCEECLRLAGEHVVVAQKDGSIQGFDARSGRRAWALTMDDPPRRLPLVGDRLMLLQPTDEDGKRISLIDPATGAEAQRVEASCPNTSFPGQVERPDDYSSLLFTPDGRTLYATFGFFGKCAQRWDLAGGKRVWQTALDEAAPPEWNASAPSLLTEEAIFFGHQQGDEGALWAMDTATGELRRVVAKKKYTFLPVAARDGVVIALTRPNWDRKKLLLIGLDSRTGETRWEFKPQAQDARAIDVHGHIDWRLTRQGLLLVQVLEDERQMIVETLDLRTGASAGRRTTQLDGSGSHVFWQALWSNDMAWLDIGSSVYALDLATGATAYRLD